jgi:5-methylcytosine-specific restriction protein A
MGRTLEKAITDRADELPTVSDQPCPRSQRNADALVAIAQDSLDGTETDTDAPAPHVTVFIDATGDGDAEPADTAQIAFGPRVGPNTLEGLLCTGRIQIVGLDDGSPVVTSRATRAIPRAIRHAVMHRDGRCTIDGCRSRYRLEPHHITPWSHGGDHSIDNLTTLCWYHHHVAIHGQGYRIDPESPPQRRRLTRIRAQSGTDPPSAASG